MTHRARQAASFFSDDKGNSWLIILAGLFSIGFVAAHVNQVFTFYLPSGQFKIMHVGGTVVLLMLFASAFAQRTSSRILHLILALAAAAVIWYVFAEFRALTRQRSFLPNDTDLVFALVFLALCLYASMREWGWVVSTIAIVGLLYGYFGQAMPGGLLYHGGLDFKRLIGYTSIPYFQGLLGSLFGTFRRHDLSLHDLRSRAPGHGLRRFHHAAGLSHRRQDPRRPGPDRGDLLRLHGHGLGLERGQCRLDRIPDDPADEARRFQSRNSLVPSNPSPSTGGQNHSTGDGPSQPS